MTFELNRPVHTVDRLAALIQQELPGAQFRLEPDSGSYATVLEFRRQREGYKAAISAEIATDDGLAKVTLEAIDAFREGAMQDYGLRAVLDREKKEAFKEGFQAMVKNLEGYVEQHMAEWVTVLDENGHEKEVKGGPDYQGARILAWLKALSVPARSDADRA